MRRAIASARGRSPWILISGDAIGRGHRFSDRRGCAWDFVLTARRSVSGTGCFAGLFFHMQSRGLLPSGVSSRKLLMRREACSGKDYESFVARCVIYEIRIIIFDQLLRAVYVCSNLECYWFFICAENNVEKCLLYSCWGICNEAQKRNRRR